MLRRLKLRTKLRLLLATAVVATVGLGGATVNDRVHAWRETTTGSDLAEASARLGTLLHRTEVEATLSVQYLSSGDPAVRRTLNAARPKTDRAARALAIDRATLAPSGLGDSVRSLTTVDRRWEALRRSRIAIDRRTVGDVAMLLPFDDVTDAVVRALDSLAAATTGPPARDLRARAAIASIEAGAASEQTALLVAIEREEISRPIVKHLVIRAARQQALRSLALAAATRRNRRLGTAAREVESAAAAVGRFRAPALDREVPFISPAMWERATDRQLEALRTIGRILENTAADRALAQRAGARDRLVRAAQVVGAMLVAELLIGIALIRAITRPIKDVARAALNVAKRLQESSPAVGAEWVVAPVAVRTRDEVGAIARAIREVDDTSADRAHQLRTAPSHDIGDGSVDFARFADEVPDVPDVPDVPEDGDNAPRFGRIPPVHDPGSVAIPKPRVVERFSPVPIDRGGDLRPTTGRHTR